MLSATRPSKLNFQGPAVPWRASHLAFDYHSTVQGLYIYINERCVQVSAKKRGIEYIQMENKDTSFELPIMFFDYIPTLDLKYPLMGTPMEKR